MRTEVAFSIEFGQLINAERAYELYWAEVIHDKRAFSCPEDGCTARYTCANMDKPEKELKQQPHFREMVPHKVGCEVEAEVLTLAAAERGSSTTAAVGSPSSDMFVLSRPAGHFIAAITDPGAAGENYGVRTVSGGPGSGARSRGSKFYSVGSLVSRWLKARSRDADEVETVQIGRGSRQTYRSLFECLYPKGRALTGDERVYWGKAWIRRTKEDSGYLVRFDTPVTLSSNASIAAEGVKPTFFIMDDKVEQFPMKRLLAKRLERFVERDAGQCIAFVFGEPIIKRGAKDSDQYINFVVSNLDLISLEPIALFDEIRKRRD